jgi:hypothetical protein
MSLLVRLFSLTTSLDLTLQHTSSILLHLEFLLFTRQQIPYLCQSFPGGVCTSSILGENSLTRYIEQEGFC